MILILQKVNSVYFLFTLDTSTAHLRSNEQVLNECPLSNENQAVQGVNNFTVLEPLDINFEHFEASE